MRIKQCIAEYLLGNTPDSEYALSEAVSYSKTLQTMLYQDFLPLSKVVTNCSTLAKAIQFFKDKGISSVVTKKGYSSGGYGVSLWTDLELAHSCLVASNAKDLVMQEYLPKYILIRTIYKWWYFRGEDH